MIIIWSATMPKDDIKTSIDLEFPDQAAYMSTNFLFYIIHTGMGVALCAGAFNIFILLGVFLVNVVFALYITIWNFTQHSVVFDKAWEAS